LNRTKETSISTQATNCIKEELVGSKEELDRMNDLAAEWNDINTAWSGYEIWSISLQILATFVTALYWFGPAAPAAPAAPVDLE
jgi:hypothetical protein